MPAIEWRALPRQVQDHLMDRLRVREISAQDLRALLSWINADPQVPEGAWCKDFGSFKLVGEGKNPKTFLSKDSRVTGPRSEPRDQAAPSRAATSTSAASASRRSA